MVGGLLMVSACASKTVDSGDDSDASETDTDVEPACVALTSGRWEGSGPAFGMAMGVDLTMDEADCSFTLTNWSMDMGPIADAGTVDGEEVTLAGPDDYWSSCTGTVEDAGSVSGVCTEDGAAFELVLDE